MKISTLNRGKLLHSLLVGALLSVFSPVTSKAQTNDVCSAPQLGSAVTCNITTGNLPASATYTAIPSACGSSNRDVWYRFTAYFTSHTVQLGSLTQGRIQVYGGTCTSLTSIACGNTSVSLTGLTVGATYFIRIYSNNNSTGNFDICVRHTAPAVPGIEISKSYVNLTKGSFGGTIEPGDYLEIRAILVARTSSAHMVSFRDVLPANTWYVTNSLRILTNEGKIYRQWTDAMDTDPGTFNGGNISINIGRGANQTTGGTVINTDRPSLFGSSCVLMASYQVQVQFVPYGTAMPLGGGSITYRTDPGSSDIVYNFPPINAMIYRSTGICANTTGSNIILSEFGGTFGSGATKDRTASTNVPSNYSYNVFTTGNPGDNRYGVSNNTSSDATTNFSINPNEPFPSTRRVFGVWDIIGDHTGAANPLAGNAPANVVTGQPGGYMVVVNASYRTDTAFRDTIRGLCPNTSYEYSAWFRNICRRCGCDSVGRGTATAGYLPTGPGDSSGVKPNLTFNVNGFDYYTTGDIQYTGQWIKKGFTYRTGPNETEMVIAIRNNSPGGGGNDWAIDDIAVSTCTPNLNILPGPQTNVCYGNQVGIFAEIKSFFDNYTFVTWEKSVDSGLTWTSTGVVDVLNYNFINGEYIDTTYFPPFIGDSVSHLNRYRVRVASSLANLSNPACSFIASTLVVVYVNNCSQVLPTKILQVSGKLQENRATINWTTSNESLGTLFDVERSDNGAGFRKIGTVSARFGHGAGGSYSLQDPDLVLDKAFYRIKMLEGNSAKFSKTIQLQAGKQALQVFNIANPFFEQLKFGLQVSQSGMAQIEVYDNVGRMLVKQSANVNAGSNDISVPGTRALSAGTYTLRIQVQQEMITQRIMKLDR